MKRENAVEEGGSQDLLIGLSAGAADTKGVLIAKEIVPTTPGARNNSDTGLASFDLIFLGAT